MPLVKTYLVLAFIYFTFVCLCIDDNKYVLSEVEMNLNRVNSTPDTLDENYMQLTTDKIKESTINIHGSSASNNHTLVLWRSQQWFTEDFLKLVNPHWLTFAPASKLAHQFLAGLYLLVVCVGVLGNTLVIFMFIRCRSLQTPANILITNLAVSDLLMMMMIPIFIYNSFHQGIALGEIGCEIYGFVGGLTGTVSICTLAAIALDRYYVVVYPLNRSSKTIRAKISVTVAWIYGGIFSSIPLMKFEFITYVPEGYLTSCSFDYLSSSKDVKIFILCYFIAAWLVPFFIITACYSKIIKVVLQARNISKQMQDPTLSSRHYKEEEQKKKEIRFAIVVLAIIGLWFVAWTPYAIVALLGISGYKNVITPLTSMIPALFCKVASCLDPYLYAVSNQRFKDELRVLCCRRRFHRENILKKVWSTIASSGTTVNREDLVEEVVVTIDTVSTEQQKINSQTGYCMVQPVVELPINITHLGKNHRTPWIFKPNFSNRSSSFRSIARTWNKSKENSIEEHTAV